MQLWAPKNSLTFAVMLLTARNRLFLLLPIDYFATYFQSVVGRSIWFGLFEYLKILLLQLGMLILKLL